MYVYKLAMHFSTLLCCVTASTLFFVSPLPTWLVQLSRLAIFLHVWRPQVRLSVRRSVALAVVFSGFHYLRTQGRPQGNAEVPCIYDCLNYKIHASTAFKVIAEQTARQFLQIFFSRFTACVLPIAGCWWGNALESSTYALLVREHTNSESLKLGSAFTRRNEEEGSVCGSGEHRISV